MFGQMPRPSGESWHRKLELGWAAVLRQDGGALKSPAVRGMFRLGSVWAGFSQLSSMQERHRHDLVSVEARRKNHPEKEYYINIIGWAVGAFRFNISQ